MFAFQFDHEGLFVGTVERQIDPLESERQGRDVYLLPLSSTSQEPPTPGEGERVRWAGSLWISEQIPIVEPERDVTQPPPTYIDNSEPYPEGFEPE